MIIWDEYLKNILSNNRESHGCGIEALIEEETEEQITYRINFWASGYGPSYSTTTWGFDWQIVACQENIEFSPPYINSSPNDLQKIGKSNHFERTCTINFVADEAKLIDYTFITIDKNIKYKVLGIELTKGNTKIIRGQETVEPKTYVKIFDNYIPFLSTPEYYLVQVLYNQGVMRTDSNILNYSTGLSAVYDKLSDSDRKYFDFDPDLETVYMKEKDKQLICYPQYDNRNFYKFERNKKPVDDVTYREKDVNSTEYLTAEISTAQYGPPRCYYDGFLYGYNTSRDGTGEEFAPEFKYKKNKSVTLYPDVRAPIIKSQEWNAGTYNPETGQTDWGNPYTSAQYGFLLDINYEPEQLDWGSKIASIGIAKENNGGYRYFLYNKAPKYYGYQEMSDKYQEWIRFTQYNWGMLWGNPQNLLGIHPAGMRFKEWNTKSDGTGVTVTQENASYFFESWRKHYYWTNIQKDIDGTQDYYQLLNYKPTLNEMLDDLENGRFEENGEFVYTIAPNDWDDYAIFNSTTGIDMYPLTLVNIKQDIEQYSSSQVIRILRIIAKEQISGYAYDGIAEDVIYTENGIIKQINIPELGTFIKPEYQTNFWDSDRIDIDLYDYSLTDSWQHIYSFYSPDSINNPEEKIRQIETGLVKSLNELIKEKAAIRGYSDYSGVFNIRLYAIWEPDEATVVLDNHLIVYDKDYSIIEEANYDNITVAEIGEIYKRYQSDEIFRENLSKNYGYKISDKRAINNDIFIPFSKWKMNTFNPFKDIEVDYEITFYKQFVKQVKPDHTFGEPLIFTPRCNSKYNINLTAEQIEGIVGPGAIVKYWIDQNGNKFGEETPNRFSITIDEKRKIILTPVVEGKQYGVDIAFSEGNQQVQKNAFYAVFTFGVENLDPYPDEFNRKLGQSWAQQDRKNFMIKGWKINNNNLIYNLTIALASNIDYINPSVATMVITEKPKDIFEFYDGETLKFSLPVYSDDYYDDWCISHLFNVRRFFKNGYVFDGCVLDGVKIINKNFNLLADSVMFQKNGESYKDIKDKTINTYKVYIQWKWAPGVIIEKKNYTCHVYVNGKFKEALPYVYHNGRWQIATYDWRGVK